MPCGWPSPHGRMAASMQALDGERDTTLPGAPEREPLFNAQQLTEYAGVTHRVTVSVVVEVHEDVLAGSIPFVEPVSPPTQILD